MGPHRPSGQPEEGGDLSFAVSQAVDQQHSYSLLFGEPFEGIWKFRRQTTFLGRKSSSCPRRTNLEKIIAKFDLFNGAESDELFMEEKVADVPKEETPQPEPVAAEGPAAEVEPAKDEPKKSKRNRPKCSKTNYPRCTTILVVPNR